MILIQCTQSKRSAKATARTLYDESDLFVAMRDYAEATADEWFVQSAEYGLLRPKETVQSYNTHAKDLDEVDTWAEQIADELAQAVPSDATVEILCGRAYADPLTPALESHGFEVLEPLRGQGIGERMASLDSMATRSLEGYV